MPGLKSNARLSSPAKSIPLIPVALRLKKGELLCVVFIAHLQQSHIGMCDHLHKYAWWKSKSEAFGTGAVINALGSVCFAVCHRCQPA